MSLKERAEELKAQLAEATEREEKELENGNNSNGDDKPVDTKVEEDKDKPKEETPTEEVKVDEQPKAEEKPAEPVKTASDYAKERRDSRDRKMADELAVANAKIAELTKPREVKSDEPDRAADPEAWRDWKIAKQDRELEQIKTKTERLVEDTQSKDLRLRAEQEIQGYENVTRQAHTDYDSVKSFYVNMLAASIKIVNPKITNEDLVKTVNDRLIIRASELLNDGHSNPIEAIYVDAKAMGYQPPAVKEVVKTEVKPDLKKVAANRARNAGTAGAQGDSGQGDLTPTVAAGLTNREFSKLKPEEKQRVLRQLQQAS